MIKFLVKTRSILVKIVGIGSPLIAVLLIYFMGFSPIEIMKKIFNPTIFSKIPTNVNMYLIDSTILIFFINILMEIFRYPGKFTMEMKNKDRRSRTSIPIGTTQKTKKLDIDLKINFKNTLFKFLINQLGGINFVLWIPSWITFTIANKQDFEKQSFLEKKEHIVMDISKNIGKLINETPLYIEAVLISNATSTKEGEIVAEFIPSSTNVFKRFFVYVLIFFFFEIKTTSHKIETSVSS